MTTESVKKWWKEIEALKNGETIQVQVDPNEWVDSDSPEFASTSHYRIKPKAPKLCPFCGHASLKTSRKGLNFITFECTICHERFDIRTGDYD